MVPEQKARLVRREREIAGYLGTGHSPISNALSNFGSYVGPFQYKPQPLRRNLF
jgi:hypothetical protein